MSELLKMILDYSSYIVIALSLLITIIQIIIQSVKGKNVKAKALRAVDLVSKLKELETTVIPEAIMTAEKSGITTGAAKKILALSEIMLQCNEMGIDYEENKEEIDQVLEAQIETTKAVNVKPRR